MADADGRSADADGQSRSKPTEWTRPTWPRIAGIVALLVLAFFVSRSSEQSQQITEEQAIAIAERQVDFEPEQTQIRLLRQGIPSEPFWFVVLSVPSRQDEDAFSKLAQFRVNANTGEVEEIAREEAQQPRKRRENHR